MLYDFAVLYSPEVIISSRFASKSSFADGQNKVAVRKNLVDFVINHLDALVSQFFQCCSKTRQTVCHTDVVLDIRIPLKVISCFFRVMAFHYIIEKVLYKLTVCFRFIQVFCLYRSFDLGMTGQIRFCQRGNIVSVFCDFTVFIKAEDIKSHLFSGTCEVIDRLQEYLVPVFIGADIFNSSFYGSLSQSFYRLHEGLSAGARRLSASLESPVAKVLMRASAFSMFVMIVTSCIRMQHPGISSFRFIPDASCVRDKPISLHDIYTINIIIMV